MDVPNNEEERLAAWGVAAEGASQKNKDTAAAVREQLKTDYKSWR